MDFGTLLSQYGLPGIIIFALGMVVVYLNSDRNRYIDRLFDIQEQRRLEALETAKALSSTLQSFTQATTMLTSKIEMVKGKEL